MVYCAGIWQAHSWVVICGTTGESAALNLEEKRELWRVAVEEVAGKMPVIAGTGTSSTATTINETRVRRIVELMVAW